MLWYVLLVILVVVLLCAAFFFYDEYKFDKEIAQEYRERTLVENRLTESLKILCSQLGIDLSYHEELGTAAGRILYHSMNGRLFVDDAKIEILKKYENEPYVLAHELGHYMAIKQRQDNSERGADDEADKLCRLILNKREQELLSIGLKCHFHDKEVVD